MQNPFNFYHRQNEIILQLVLLPFTLAAWLIKKAYKAIASRYANRKH